MMMGKPYTDKEEDLILRFWDTDMRDEDLAERVGRPRQSLRRHAQKTMGLVPRRLARQYRLEQEKA
jgi:AraC-like DNA-binding protein